MKGLDEFALIRRLTALRQTVVGGGPQVHGVHVGIGDDAAVVEVTSDFHTVLTCDTMVEGVHFKQITMKNADIGFKAMASNISDIAAMGAIPRYALVCLTAPRSMSIDVLEQIYEGLYECASLYDVVVVGGDTTSTPGGLTISVTLVGEVEAGRALVRSTAQPGDVVFVAGGRLGYSAAGLDFLLHTNRNAEELTEQDLMVNGLQLKALVAAHQRPLPQVKAGRLLLESGHCHALNDISDGLASETWEIAEASDCGIALQEAWIPVDANLEKYAEIQGGNAIDWILYGGEDYQLVGTAPEQWFNSLQQSLANEGLSLYKIGRVRADFHGVQMLMQDGSTRAIDKKGYNHFST